MPIIERSTYQPPAFFGNGHIQSIYPSLFRKVTGIAYQRERVDTPDGDFLDLDWSRIGSENLVIISHGLEGNTTRSYIKGMIRIFNQNGWDALAWNYRGCSGEPNRLLKFYHSGATEDLEVVVRHALSGKTYRSCVLLGFSLGGNLTLKYLGEREKQADPRIVKAIAFSAPCDLKSSAIEMERPSNKIYMSRFLRLLNEKIEAKKPRFPGQLDNEDYHTIKTFRQFDDRYTAPLHGFRDAEEYWARSSSKPLLGKIAIPTLMISAKNDPFLGDDCYPVEAARNNNNLYLEIPDSGGHVGFIEFSKDGSYWSERRALAFLSS